MQEREFKLLPDAWGYVSEAFGLARWLCSPMQQYASLQYLSDAETEEFLAKSELLETQKEKLRGASANARDKLWQNMVMCGQRHNQCALPPRRRRL